MVTLFNWDWDYEEAKQSMAHEVTLHVAFVHAFVNPSLLMVLHRRIRQVCVDYCRDPYSAQSNPAQPSSSAEAGLDSH